MKWSDVSQRDKSICILRADGWSYDQIAKVAGVGKVRCRQIVKRIMDAGLRIKPSSQKVIH